MESGLMHLKQGLESIGFQGDFEKTPSKTRWGPGYTGTWQGDEVIVVVYEAQPRNGVRLDLAAYYGLKQARRIISGMSRMMQPLAVRLLHTGDVAVVFDKFVGTVEEVLQHGLTPSELSNTEEPTPLGSQVVRQMRDLLETCYKCKLLHPEVDLSSLVVVYKDSNKLDIRLLPSPHMQRLADCSVNGYLVHIMAAPNGTPSPPELAKAGVAQDRVSLASFMFQVGASFASMFLGGTNMLAGPDPVAALDSLQPACLEHMFGLMLHPDPAKRASPADLKGHYYNYYKDPAKLGDFLVVAGNNVAEFCRNKDRKNPIGLALRDLAVSTALEGRRVSSLPGGTIIANALMYHYPGEGSGGPHAFNDDSHADTWDVPKLLVAIRHAYQHHMDKLGCRQLRSMLGNPSTKQKFIGELVKKAFKPFAWNVWKHIYDNCLTAALNSELCDYFWEPVKDQVDGRPNKTDEQHSAAEAGAVFHPKFRASKLPAVPDTWTTAALEEDDVFLDIELGVDAAAEAAEAEAAFTDMQQVGPLNGQEVEHGGDPEGSTGDGGADGEVVPDWHRLRSSSSDGDKDEGSGGGGGGAEPAAPLNIQAAPADAEHAAAPAASTDAGPESTGAAGIEGQAASGRRGGHCRPLSGSVISPNSEHMLAHTAGVGQKRPHSTSGTPAAAGADAAISKRSSTEMQERELFAGNSVLLSGLRVVDGALDSVDEGQNLMPFRAQVPEDLPVKGLKSFIRSMSAFVALLSWHHNVTTVPLSVHAMQLMTLVEDIITAPYCGRTVCQAVAMQCTCVAAAFSMGFEIKANYERLGRTAAESLYPEANYEDQDAGAVVDLYRLAHLSSTRDARAHALRLKVVQGDIRVQQMTRLLNAQQANSPVAMLAVMAECTCLVVWHLFVTKILAVAPEQRATALQQLQIAAAKQVVRRLMNDDSCTVVTFPDMAKQLLFCPPALLPRPDPGVRVPWASNQVLRKLHEDVEDVVPQVSLAKAIHASEGKCLWRLLVNNLKLPAANSFPTKRAPENLRDRESKLEFQMHNSSMTKKMLLGEGLAEWRKTFDSC